MKTLETDYLQLLQNAAVLGVIEIGPNNEVIPVNGTAWHHIGYKKLGPPPENAVPDTRPDVADANGVKYIHINAVTHFDIGERAEQLAAGNAQIAAGLADFGKFFIIKMVDGRPKAVWPTNPIAVFC